MFYLMPVNAMTVGASSRSDIRRYIGSWKLALKMINQLNYLQPQSPSK